MFRFDVLPDLRLCAGQLICWRQHHDARLLVISGRLWVTRYGDLQDHFLAPGESIRLGRSSRALITAEAAACVRIERVEAARWIWARHAARRLLAMVRSGAEEAVRRPPATVA